MADAPPRRPAAAPAPVGPVVVLDNGGYTCKAGIGGQDMPISVVPNCAIKPKREKRFYVADQINDIIDFSQVYYKRPCERGFITDWDLQIEIWDRLFRHVLKIDTKEHGLLVSEPVCNLRALSRRMDEVAFERYDFQSYCRVPSPSMALYHAMPTEAKTLLSETYSVVVDIGYSFTHVIPFVEEAPVNHAIKRISIGGKIMTNYLKEVISYRSFSMMDETHLVNHIKETVCTTSVDFKVDLAKCKLGKKKNPYRLEYVLPSHVDGNTMGHVRPENAKPIDEEQILTLANERITIPELLFSPNLIGLKQAGLAETVAQSIDACHPDIRGLLFENIILVGGSTNFRNLGARLEKELRALAPAECKVKVHSFGKNGNQNVKDDLKKANNNNSMDVDNESKANSRKKGLLDVAEDDPALFPWKGGSAMVSNGAYAKYCLSKKVYDEYGPDACQRKFHWYV